MLLCMVVVIKKEQIVENGSFTIITFYNFLYSCSHIRENTIASLKNAANKGADFVEFDVQLTKDLIPIIYHDFLVSMATKSKTDLLANDVEMVQIPVKDFTFEQLHKLKVNI